MNVTSYITERKTKKRRYKMNYRIKKLRKELMEQKPYVDGERCRIFTESMKKTDGLPIIIRRAKSFYEVLDQMKIGRAHV